MFFLKSWFPAFLWASFIFFLSTRQNVSLPVFPFADKIAHVVLYTVFGFFVARALFCAHNVSSQKLIWLTVLIAGLYGSSDEFHQSFVPTRGVEALDILSDLSGGLIGSLIYGFKIRISKNN